MQANQKTAPVHSELLRISEFRFQTQLHYSLHVKGSASAEIWIDDEIQAYPIADVYNIGKDSHEIAWSARFAKEPVEWKEAIARLVMNEFYRLGSPMVPRILRPPAHRAGPAAT